jgi:hypothetical protein
MKLSKSCVVGMAVLLVFAGCGTGEMVNAPTQSDNKILEPSTSSPDGIITLAFGESVVIDASGLTATFADVPHESRCPMNAFCFWEGMAVVELTVTEYNGTMHTLNLSSIDHAPGDLEPSEDLLGYRFTLVQVMPYPYDLDPPIPLDAYEAYLTIEPIATVRDALPAPLRPSKTRPVELRDSDYRLP